MGCCFYRPKKKKHLHLVVSINKGLKRRRPRHVRGKFTLLSLGWWVVVSMGQKRKKTLTLSFLLTGAFNGGGRGMPCGPLDGYESTDHGDPPSLNA